MGANHKEVFSTLDAFSCKEQKTLNQSSLNNTEMYELTHIRSP